MADWSALQGKVLDVIARKLEKLSDNLNFSAVCSSWRSVGLERRHNICHPFFPRLVIPGETKDSGARSCLEAVQGEKNGYLTFYRDNYDVKKNLAEQIPVPHGCYCCGSSLGWLVLIDDSFDMRLLNPLSGASFDLPSSTTLPPALPDFAEFCKYYVDKAIISLDPTAKTPTSSETIVLLIYSGAPQRLAFCRLGDTAWTPIKSSQRKRSYTDAIYSKGKFYAICDPGYCDIVDIEHQTVIQYAVPPPSEIAPENRFIVESDGQLFLVVRKVTYDGDSNNRDGEVDVEEDEAGSAEENSIEDRDELDNNEDEDEDGDVSVDENNIDDSDDNGDEFENNDESNNCTDCGGPLEPNDWDWDKWHEILRRYRTVLFRVYKLKEYPDGSRIWMKVKSIGNNAFFIGYNSSFSLPATDNLGFKTCKPNSIYFTDDHKPLERLRDPIRHDIGVFSLDSQTIESIYPADTKIMRPPPFWLNLNSK